MFSFTRTWGRILSLEYVMWLVPFIESMLSFACNMSTFPEVMGQLSYHLNYNLILVQHILVILVQWYISLIFMIILLSSSAS
ncbi:putative integral membrane protein [Brugia pahangi]